MSSSPLMNVAAAAAAAAGLVQSMALVDGVVSNDCNNDPTFVFVFVFATRD